MATNRWNRRPRFLIGANTATPGIRKLLASTLVNPGETCTELRTQLRIRTNPADILDCPAYIEVDAYYVPLRLCDEGFPDFLLNGGALTLGTYASESAARGYLSSNGAYKWGEVAFSKIAENYWNADDVSNPHGWVRNTDVDWTAQQTVEDADVTIPAGAFTTNELDEAYGERDFEVRRQSWDGSYLKFMQSMGIQVKEDALSVPERLFRYRKFVDPATIVDPSTGGYKSVWTTDIDRTVKKPIFFQEHGLVMLFVSLTPRIIQDELKDPLSLLVSPEQFPIPAMLNAHVMSESTLHDGAAPPTERISTNEFLWRGRHFIGGGTKTHDSRDNILVQVAASRQEMLFPASAVADAVNGTGFYNPTTTTWETLQIRTFGDNDQQNIRVNGLLTKTVKTRIPRVGSDWRPKVMLGGNY